MRNESVCIRGQPLLDRYRVCCRISFLMLLNMHTLLVHIEVYINKYA